jgi:hypothetical protein
VPPLALLALMLGAYLALTLGLFLIVSMTAPVAMGALLCALFFASICLAWWRHGQEIIPLRWLIFAPVYAFLKIPLYGRFFLDRQRVWARGDRQPIR